MFPEILNSWKEIAAHVGRGVRTVQRWERELGFPVHRPRGKDRSAVIAIKAEVNAWLRNPPADTHAPATYGEFGKLRDDLHMNARLLVQRAHLLRSNSQALNATLDRTMRLSCKMNRTEPGKFQRRIQTPQPPTRVQ